MFLVTLCFCSFWDLLLQGLQVVWTTGLATSYSDRIFLLRHPIQPFPENLNYCTYLISPPPSQTLLHHPHGLLHPHQHPLYPTNIPSTPPPSRTLASPANTNISRAGCIPRKYKHFQGWPTQHMHTVHDSKHGELSH
jgi:hypothetical protein